MSGSQAGNGLDPAIRTALEHDLLPAYLSRQRWFPAKARGLARVWVRESTGSGVLAEGCHLTLVEATFDDGGTATYLLPVTIEPWSGEDPRAIGAIDLPAGRAQIRDGLGDERLIRALVRLIGDGGELIGSSGTFRGLSTAAFTAAAGANLEHLRVRAGSADQSNSAAFLGDRLILKGFRRVEPGVNPDFEIGRFLTDRARFDRVPTTAGALEYHDGRSEPATLAILQAVVPNQGSGWEHALEGLARFYKAVDEFSASKQDACTPPSDAPGPAGEQLLASAREAAILGRRTAELHQALASDRVDPAFAPQAIGREVLQSLVQEIRSQVERTLETLRASLERLRPNDRAAAQQVLYGADSLMSRLDRLVDLGAAGEAIRVHGDYHLGQVLWDSGDYVILDFEGEPAKSLQARRAKHSPLKDVAGILRSYDYAAFAGLFAATEDDPVRRARLAPWARGWQQSCTTGFLEAYQSVAGKDSFLPADRTAFAALLSAYTLDKTLYELQYELNNRPDWVRIPLQGVTALQTDAATSGEPGDRPA